MSDLSLLVLSFILKDISLLVPLASSLTGFCNMKLSGDRVKFVGFVGSSGYSTAQPPSRYHSKI